MVNFLSLLKVCVFIAAFDFVCQKIICQIEAKPISHLLRLAFNEKKEYKKIQD